MADRWGCKPWGSLWGLPVINLQAEPLPNPPAQALISWDTRDGEDYVYAVYIDKRFYASTRNRQMIVTPGHEGRFYFEVYAIPETIELLADSLAGCFDPTIRGDRIRLEWTRLAGGASWGSMMWGGSGWSSGGTAGGGDVGQFDVYWDEGLGTSPLVLLERINAGAAFDPEAGTYSYTTTALPDGTYVFRVDPLDFVGNVLTPSALTVSHVHDPPPKAPKNLLVTTFAFATEEFTATWTPSTSSDVVSYRVYDNGGTGGDVDYEVVRATIAAPASGGTWARPGAAAGFWTVALRAVDAIGEETNVDVRFSFELGGAPLQVLGQQPSVPVNIIVSALPGAAMALLCEYTAENEGAVGTLVRWFNNGGVLAAPIDFSTVVASVSIPTHVFRASQSFTVQTVTAPLTDGAYYKWAAKAESAIGRRSEASLESALIQADGTPPPDNATLGAESVI